MAVDDDESDDEPPESENIEGGQFNYFSAPVVESGHSLNELFPADGDDNDVEDDSNLPDAHYEWTECDVKQPTQTTQVVLGKTVVMKESMILSFLGPNLNL